MRSLSLCGVFASFRCASVQNVPHLPDSLHVSNIAQLGGRDIRPFSSIQIRGHFENGVMANRLTKTYEKHIACEVEKQFVMASV